MTPTPTDPREEKQMRPCEHRSDGLCGECLAVLNKYILEDEALTDRRITSLESTNSKLAAEIAELKAQKRPFSDKLADEVIKGQVKRITELETSLATLRAELEAFKTENTRIYREFVSKEVFETLSAELEAARKELESEREDKQTAIDLVNERGDKMQAALAAKDVAEKERDQINEAYDSAIGRATDKLIAAEKRVARLEDVLRFVRDECDWERGDSDQPFGGGDGRIGPAITAALTPAPTQESPVGVIHGVNCDKVAHNSSWGYLHAPDDDGPYNVDSLTYCGRCHSWLPKPPAGGVTISNDSSGETGRRTSNEADRLARADNSMGVQVPPAVTSSVSPASVPSEGRGELLPFNLADALAGKPVVTRDGRKVEKLRTAGSSLFLYPICGRADGEVWTWTKEGKETIGKDSPLDLFMLPTEGSGA